MERLVQWRGLQRWCGMPARKHSDLTCLVACWNSRPDLCVLTASQWRCRWLWLPGRCRGTCSSSTQSIVHLDQSWHTPQNFCKLFQPVYADEYTQLRAEIALRIDRVLKELLCLSCAAACMQTIAGTVHVCGDHWSKPSASIWLLVCICYMYIWLSYIDVSYDCLVYVWYRYIWSSHDMYVVECAAKANCTHDGMPWQDHIASLQKQM